MMRYLDALDETNAKILEGLGTHGPRNISALAKEIKLSPTTVAFRLSKLMQESNLRIRARVDFQKLGLQRAVVFTEAKPGKQKILRTIIENHPYWTYTIRSFGKYEGTYALYSFPAQSKREFEAYFKEASKQNVLEEYTVFFVTDFCELIPSFQWFDFKKRSWTFQWGQWLKEIENAQGTMPKRFQDSETYPILADKTDLLILKELEKNGSTEFKELAKTVSMTPEAVRYRFQNHILKRGLIADYEISIFPYPWKSSDLTSFAIDFRNQTSVAKFVNSLLHKPFVVNYAKVTEQNKIIVHFFTPKTEFSHLIDSLNRLIEMNFVERFFHVTLDIPSYKHQTVSYEFFTNNKWVYNHEKLVDGLKKMLA